MNNWTPQQGMNNITGNNGCYVCGADKPTQMTWLYLTDYGVRTRQHRPLCASCRSASKRGVL